MLRRKPTRLELKIDDTAEFESVKKELEVWVLMNISIKLFQHCCVNIHPILITQNADVSATTDSSSVICWLVFNHKEHKEVIWHA